MAGAWQIQYAPLGEIFLQAMAQGQAEKAADRAARAQELADKRAQQQLDMEGQRIEMQREDAARSENKDFELGQARNQAAYGGGLQALFAANPEEALHVQSAQTAQTNAQALQAARQQAAQGNYKPLMQANPEEAIKLQAEQRAQQDQGLTSDMKEYMAISGLKPGDDGFGPGFDKWLREQANLKAPKTTTNVINGNAKIPEKTAGRLILDEAYAAPMRDAISTIEGLGDPGQFMGKANALKGLKLSTQAQIAPDSMSPEDKSWLGNYQTFNDETKYLQKLRGEASRATDDENVAKSLLSVGEPTDPVSYAAWKNNIKRHVVSESNTRKGLIGNGLNLTPEAETPAPEAPAKPTRREPPPTTAAPNAKGAITRTDPKTGETRTWNGKAWVR